MNVLLNSIDQNSFDKVSISGVPIDSLTTVIWVTFALVCVNLLLMFTSMFENELHNEDYADKILLTLEDGDKIKKYVGVVRSKNFAVYRWQHVIFVLKILTPIFLFLLCFWLSFFP